MTDSWRPDIKTFDWGLSIVDEPGIGRMVIDQLELQFPQIVSIDPDLLGEAAVESVLFSLINRAIADAKKRS